MLINLVVMFSATISKTEIISCHHNHRLQIADCRGIVVHVCAVQFSANFCL